MPNHKAEQLKQLIARRLFAEQQVSLPKDQRTTIDFADIDGKTLLEYAILDGDLTKVKRLIEVGALPTSPRYMASALHNNQFEIAKHLAENGCSFLSVELDKVTEPKAQEWYKKQLQEAVNEANSSDFIFSGIDKTAPCASFFECSARLPHLEAAVALGDIQTVSALKPMISTNPKVIAKLLCIAVKNNQKDMLDLLLTVPGADISCTNLPYAMTPLHTAVLKGNTAMVKYCLSLGADVNKQDKDKRVPLAYAGQSVAILELLLESKPNLFLYDCERRSVLHHYAESATPACFERLMSLPAVRILINKKDYYGYTAADIAYLNEQFNFVKKLCPFEKPPGAIARPMIAQALLIKKIAYFIRLRNPSYVSEGGYCHGLSILHAYYASRKMRTYFFQVLQLLANWDGDEEQLKAPLPADMQSVSDVKMEPYKNQGELFEQWINDIRWAQHVLSQDITEFRQFPYLNYMKGMYPDELLKSWQYTILESEKRTTDGRQAHMFFKALTATLPNNTSIEVSGAQHASNIFIESSNQFAYYDPNIKYSLDFFSEIEPVAKRIIENQFVSHEDGYGRHHEVEFTPCITTFKTLNSITST